MTDRSFGDHSGRNFVKNPLLSTAVTGLSLEDLTHNAVLLPVSLSQEVITRPEHGTQSQALGNTSHITPSFPSGDAFSNIRVLHQHPNPHPTITSNVHPNKKTENPNENVCSTQSKASTKTEDDFDVNEYFARLQGTRYVSAPLNSSLKEDTNANLPQSEENLEEINLTEPQAETQQSITSDIAQNFSQLPTVLPQVASAVFSSFSNMLSMKSREQTPDTQMHPAGHQVRVESRDVPLMVAESRMEPPPPPLKEPPPVGTGNYRLATTKKKYAQIPGLTSGDTAHNAIVYNPMNQNVPSFFTPVTHDVNIQERRTDISSFVPTDRRTNKKEESYNIFTPVPNEQSTQDHTTFGQNQHNPQASQVLDEPPKLPPPQPNVPIIPPPPMFSNTQARDNQIAVEKTILPPSVARRISGNQPIMKQQVSVPSCPEHIFMLPPAFETGATSNTSALSYDSSSLDLKPPIASVSSSASTVFSSTGNSSTSSHSSTSVSGISSIQQPSPLSSVGIGSSASTTDVFGQPPADILLSMGIASGTLPPPPSVASSISTSSVPSAVSVFTPVESPQSQENIPTPALFDPSSQAKETSVMAPAPSFFNPAEMAKVPSVMPQPSFFNPVDVTKETTSMNTSSSTFVPPPFSMPASTSQPCMPPTYFNSSIPEPPKEFQPDGNMLQYSSQYFAAGTSAEPPKPLPDPPKATGNVNFRMAKKRPQYYSGPIVGVGSISNNVKPVVEPVEANAFQGGIFVPQAQEATEQLSNSIVETSVPFDISRPTQNPQYSQPEQSFVKPQYATDARPQYNTAFDLSRPNTENYEHQKEENKGFGFIGSLKSKLSSLDINKIQSSVTTFFDPAYNDTKKDDHITQQNKTYDPVGQYPTGQSSFEIFVPSIQPAHQYSQIYDCQMSFQDQQNQQQYYQAPDSQNYCHSQSTNVYNAPNYPAYNLPAQQENVSQTYMESGTTNLSGCVPLTSQFTNTEQNLPSVSVGTQETYQNLQNINTEVDSVRSINMSQPADQSSQTKITEISNDTTQTEQEHVRFVFKDNKDHFPEDSGTKSFFGSYANQTGHAQGNIFESLQTLQKRDDDDLTVKKEIQNIAQNILATEESPEHFFDHKMSSVLDFPHKLFKDNNDQSMYSIDKSVKDAANALSDNDSAPKPQEGTYLENEMRKMSLSEISENVNAEFTHSSNTSSKESSETKENPLRDVSELSICETCREFDKPEDRVEVEDLTTQLIENITSPIQLLNPVEVPLTESDSPINITENFNIDQCADISHIIEDTIETLHVQSVVELLQDEDVADARNYGWNTENTNLTTVNPTSQESTVPNPNAIGFFGGDSIFSDNNMPKNASDEIKAEFKFTHEEPVVPMRQISTPSAPPAEDIKLEEPGIDVHSIEQDARNDFPVYEEFVIEPSETDDDKIECKERRRSSEDIKNIDSFTNRVERFKKMGEKETDIQKSSFSLSSTSPSLPIASYFDTGNYAVETHYRNSLTSPPDVSSLNTVSPNQVSVPPGFEDVYIRNLSGMHSQDAASVPYISECNAETRPTYSPTFQTVKVTSVTTASIVTPQLSHFETNPAILPLPHFQSTFCYNLETDQQPYVLKPTNPEDRSTQPQGVSRITNPLDKRPDAEFDLRQVPNCGTQTKPLFSPTFSTARTQSSDVSMTQQASSSRPVADFQNPISNIKEPPKDAKDDTPPLHPDQDKVEVPRTHSRTPRKPVENRNMPILANIFGVNDEPQAVHPIPKHHDLSSNKPQLPARLPAFSNIFDTQKDSIGKIEAPPLFEASDEDVLKVQKPLPDPINFFSPNVDSVAQSSSIEDSSTNRLASYFSSPAKNDSSKSFFELSQGQDHYRQENRLMGSGDSKTVTAPHKTLFEISQGQSHSIDTNKHLHNIPPEKYLANFNLMKDLASPQNIEVSSDQVLRTVNYFTVQYNYENLPNEFDKGEPESSKNTKDQKEQKLDDTNAEFKHGELNQNFTNTDILVYNDKTAYEIVNGCRNCCNMNVGCVKKYDYLKHEAVIGKEFKVRKSMDNNSDSKKEADDPNMAQKNLSHDKDSVTVNFGNSPLQSENYEKDSTLDEKQIATEYVPVKHHWFYRIDVDGKSIWRGFSLQDSKSLEEAYLSPNVTEQTLVSTDGGRYDVNVIGRLRISVYWSEKPSNVMRCSWFYKGTTDARYVPYTEAVAEKLEEEYRHGITTGVWHRRLTLPNNEVVIMHGPAVMVHFLQSSAADSFGSAVSQPSQLSQLLLFGKRVYRNPPKIRVCRDQPLLIDHLLFMVHGAGEYSHQKERTVSGLFKAMFFVVLKLNQTQSTMRPRVVRRGHEETEIEDVEPSNIDHLLLLCHGVGSACDIRFRNVEEVVDDFRSTSLQLVQSHYKNSCDAGIVGRVEVLPISWHSTLHSGEMGVDRRLSRITLDSIPRLRNFTNDTVLDVLFYTSPVFCQTIINTVCAELNRIYALFLSRNPGYKGGVSLGGHSLGSVILFDLLCHQSRENPIPCPSDKTYVMGNAGTGQPAIKYPKLDFHPVALYALGSPIAIFECIRGVDALGSDFCLPTCKNFFNIFHPYDPIAYRIEPLIHGEMQKVKPFLIPHHKGRKRMHLELKDTMARVGADIKQKLVESIRTTWASMWKSHTPPTDRQLEKVVEEEIEKEQLNAAAKDEGQEELVPTPEMLGKLNNGRRIDFVLQEAPLEVINEYLFAMSSHVCYWESEDTMLLMLREIYDQLGVQPDSTVPPPSMTVQRTRTAKEDDTLLHQEHPSTSRQTT